MTREEEIHKIANTISTNIGKDVDEDYICNDEYDFTIGFECGAKWADKTMLDKACEWLEEKLLCAEDHYPTLEFLSIIEYNSLKELINDFRKSMEE